MHIYYKQAFICPIRPPVSQKPQYIKYYWALFYVQKEPQVKKKCLTH